MVFSTNLNPNPHVNPIYFFYGGKENKKSYAYLTLRQVVRQWIRTAMWRLSSSVTNTVSPTIQSTICVSIVYHVDKYGRELD